MTTRCSDGSAAMASARVSWRSGGRNLGREVHHDLVGDVPRLPACGAKTIAAGVDEDPVEPLVEPGGVPQRRPLPPGLDERVVGRVLRLGRVRAGSPGPGDRRHRGDRRQGAGRPALARSWLDPDGPAVCHPDDLRRSPHDDMTVQPCETFRRVISGRSIHRKSQAHRSPRRMPPGARRRPRATAA